MLATRVANKELQSILSHLPKYTGASNIRLLVLIYAPDLKEHPLDTIQNPEDSISSSFSNIGHDQLQTSTEALGKEAYVKCDI